MRELLGIRRRQQTIEGYRGILPIAEVAVAISEGVARGLDDHMQVGGRVMLQGLETKMAGYRAMIDAVRESGGPLIVGMDANHGSLGTSLEPCDPDPEHEHAVEIEFFSNKSGHELSDALLVYLRNRPGAYEAVCRARPQGPLEVTYIHGKTPDRYDYIMVSSEFDVWEMVHDYDASNAAGSDHALVEARLKRSRAERL